MRPIIDSARLWARLMALAEIGATPAGGVNRQALSDAEIESWRLVAGWAREAGVEPSTDPAGNLFITLPGADRALAPVLVGSHLDTQPTGGRFDGVAGVMAGLEAVTSMAARGERPARDIVVAAWMNEEGSRFAPGMMGSEAFAGLRSIEAIRAACDAAGISVGEALDRVHAACTDLPLRPLGFRPVCYLELHIEQGPILEAEGRTIGVVTGIQGKKTYEIAIEGDAGHAGTLAMAERRDALAAFARIADRLYGHIGAHDSDVKFTIGRLRVEPNAPSVVPARAVFSIDLRHPDDTVLNALGAALEEICGRSATPCTAVVKPLVDAPATRFDESLRQLIARKAEARGLSHQPILSAAGHDARPLATLCPAAMIFIPCRDGVSHVEHEWAEPADLAAGASVLADVLQDLCHGHG